MNLVVKKHQTNLTTGVALIIFNDFNKKLLAEYVDVIAWNFSIS